MPRSGGRPAGWRVLRSLGVLAGRVAAAGAVAGRLREAAGALDAVPSDGEGWVAVGEVRSEVVLAAPALAASLAAGKGLGPDGPATPAAGPEAARLGDFAWAAGAAKLDANVFPAAGEGAWSGAMASRGPAGQRSPRIHGATWPDTNPARVVAA